MNKNQNCGKKSLKSFVNKSRKSTKTEIAKNRKILCEILGKMLLCESKYTANFDFKYT